MKGLKLALAISFIAFAACSHLNIIKNVELENPVITQDTELSGEVIVKGSLIVKKSANLTILPGTVIRFKRIYIDADEISDSEIVVEGSINAVGTADKKITFTSFEPAPKPADWKYLMINFARESIIQNCVIEYAYSGAQVHFTKAAILNSVFRNNYDGVRFSTAKITVANNEIYGNINGIRYEERKAAGLITGNNIHNNNIGVFCVIKSDNLSIFQNNNIFDNTDYNVKLGLKQDKDITMTNNYWGASDETKIKEKIFDKAFDEQLGEVKIAPYLIAPYNK